MKVLVRCAGAALVALVATTRHASGFGVGFSVARNGNSNHAASRRPGPSIAAAVTRSCVCRKSGGGSFTSGNAARLTSASAGVWGVVGRRAASGSEGRGGKRGCRNGSGLMMNRGNRGVTQEQQFTEGMNPSTSEEFPVCAMSKDPLLAEVLTACKAADERKAENVIALRVAQLTAVTEYMIVLEGNSRPQNQAIAQNIEETMQEVHSRVPKTQGSPESGWILLDYGDIIVHIMTPKSRSYYDLETFWGNGTPVPLEDVLSPNVLTPDAPAAVEEEVDPFWS